MQEMINNNDESTINELIFDINEAIRLNLRELRLTKILISLRHKIIEQFNDDIDVEIDLLNCYINYPRIFYIINKYGIYN